MPPRKKPQPTPSTAAKGKQPAAPKPRRSKLASENGLTADQEHEIKTAWTMFATHPTTGPHASTKEGILPTRSLRSALKAQGLAPASAAGMRELIDAVDDDGSVTYPRFLEVSAIRLHSRSDESKLEEVEATFRLFTKGGEGPINIQHLRRVAKEMREDVSDEVLRAMILEANGGSGVGRGVGIEDFRGVMVRAGVFGSSE